MEENVLTLPRHIEVGLSTDNTALSELTSMYMIDDNYRSDINNVFDECIEKDKLSNNKLKQRQKHHASASVIVCATAAYVNDDDRCHSPSLSDVDAYESSHGSTSDENNSTTEDTISGGCNSDSDCNGSPDQLSDVYKLHNSLSLLLGKEVYDVMEMGSTTEFIKSRIYGEIEDASFLVTNLRTVVDQYNQWKAELPMVEPFYAVKCNPDPVILRLLASLGVSFDCATMGEIDLVLNHLGDKLSFSNSDKASTSIVYANPAKMEHMLTHAIKNDVGMTVFDGEDELYKIDKIQTKLNKKISCLLRLTTDDKASICRFSKKFGCPVNESYRLLDVAKSLGVDVIGCSFHVGSGCGDADAYKTALSHCRMVFDYATSIHMPAMYVVDIGGGFPGDNGGYGGEGMPTFQQLSKVIRSSIASFCDGLDRSVDDIRFIAEPGRYFVSASTTICTKVYARKGGNNGYQALYVDDGVYGSFNNVVYDHASPIPQRIPANPSTASVSLAALTTEGSVAIPTAIFGPTCDGLDQLCSLESTVLERCFIDDWLIFDNMGAYTHTASFIFNGYTHFPNKSYCFV